MNEWYSSPSYLMRLLTPSERILDFMMRYIYQLHMIPQPMPFLCWYTSSSIHLNDVRTTPFYSFGLIHFSVLTMYTHFSFISFPLTPMLPFNFHISLLITSTSLWYQLTFITSFLNTLKHARWILDGTVLMNSVCSILIGALCTFISSLYVCSSRGYDGLVTYLLTVTNTHWLKSVTEKKEVEKEKKRRPSQPRIILTEIARVEHGVVRVHGRSDNCGVK